MAYLDKPPCSRDPTREVYTAMSRDMRGARDMHNKDSSTARKECVVVSGDIQGDRYMQDHGECVVANHAMQGTRHTPGEGDD
jgi:hypothetical protein